MIIKLTISYDGTNFFGWQVQNHLRTVQGDIESAIEKVFGRKIIVVGSGRTDAGVHAEGQIASFQVETSIPPEKIAFALNEHLNSDVRILKSEKVEEPFNARKSAKKKTYLYRTYVSNIEKPLKERYALMIKSEPNLEKMTRAAELLIGEHDFKAFSSTGGNVKTTVRTIYEINIVKNGDYINFILKGNGFLYNMVRIIVGTLLKIGFGKLSEENIIKMLREKDRTFGGETVPAKGLCLLKVEYL